MDSTTFLNRYQLRRGEDGAPLALQRGPGGVTYQAEDIETDEPVAVKLVPSYSFAPDELQQLETEARAAQKVSHPNVARLHDFGIQGSDVVFVTEILDGHPLDSWVAEHGPLAAPAVVRVALQVVAGLAAAAFHSVTHRSIQPGTLMIVPGQTPDGEWPLVKILNFGGVPAAVSASEFSSGRTGRSADYASPEQLKGYPVDFRSELYSLGCTMWFLLTGAPPVPGTTDKSGAVPRALEPILAQMVALDPMQRPQDPVVLQEQLRNCLASLERREGISRNLGVPVAAPSAVAVAGDGIPKPSQLLKPLALAAAVLALIGIAALAYPYVFRSDKTAAEPIGVPVGIPEKSADAAAVRTAAAPAATSSPVADVAAQVPTQAPIPTATVAVTAASVAPTAEPEQALVSVESPRPGASAAASPADAIAEDRASQPAVAANTAAESAPTAQTADNESARSETSPDRFKTQQTVAEAAAPVQQNRTASAESSRAQTAATTPQPSRAPVVKSTPKPSSKVARSAEVRRAEPPENDDVRAPAPPRGAKRAQYLGTTPEGDLVFGLPSDQRGYVAPPGSDSRRRRSRAELEPARDPEMVLPAEPVDPEDDE